MEAVTAIHFEKCCENCAECNLQQATGGFAFCNIVKEAVQSQKLTLSEMFTSTRLFIEC